MALRGLQKILSPQLFFGSTDPVPCFFKVLTAFPSCLPEVIVPTFRALEMLNVAQGLKDGEWGSPKSRNACC